ncbi:site-specific integrase [Paraburkholderia graminis]
MATLDFIHYQPFNASLSETGTLAWTPAAKAPIPQLPQIFWQTGHGWHEANVWAERRARKVDAETVKRQMKHLCNFANFVEDEKADWRDFPVKWEDRILLRFRKHLLDQNVDGILAGSTITNAMNAVVTFYRFAHTHKLIRPEFPMWTDRLVKIRIPDTTGFHRTMTVQSSDLAIPNRATLASALEDGLTPLDARDMSRLLAYSSENEAEELHLMLASGFFTGARLTTVATLTVSGLQTAREDPQIPGIYLLAVGPGTDVSTKGDVPGNLYVPRDVLNALERFAYSTSRLKREAKAEAVDKDSLFLTRSGKRYSAVTIDRLVYAMRMRATGAGLKFMRHFKFHQTRATFGTMLMEIALSSGASPAEAIDLVRKAMLHKDEKTSWTYIKFRKETRAKILLASEFHNLFTGIAGRDWTKHDA